MVLLGRRNVPCNFLPLVLILQSHSDTSVLVCAVQCLQERPLAERALQLCRGGWKGKPVVVLGRKEDVPMGLLPLVSIVARPVKHARLVTALLKATALMRSKAQVRSPVDIAQ